MRIDYVPPEKLNGWTWDVVRRGLEAILTICPDDWMPEDVYAAIKSGRASLFQFPDGFFVVEVMASPFNGKKRLNVWCMWTRPMAGAEAEDVILSELERLAAAAGCGAVRYVSPRRGWGRMMKGKFEEVGVIYERKIYV